MGCQVLYLGIFRPSSNYKHSRDKANDENRQLLVFALGTIVSQDDQALTTSMTFRESRQFQDAESFFLAAQRRMGQLLCNSDLAGAQVFFLAGVYLMSTMRPFEAWRMFVQALACCQILDSPALDDPDDKESQLHQSIYWTSFKSEL